MIDDTSERDVISRHQWLINCPNEIENEVIQGIAKSNPNVMMFEKSAILRKDHSQMRMVKLLSGCASGHEPAYTGFVGEGMLTAAVQGMIFSEPSPVAILNTLRELARGNVFGILVIVDGKTSDRLSFGVAVSRARFEDINVKLLFVDNETSKFGALCGPLILQKIAAALSAEEFSLGDIYNECQALSHDIASIIVSLKTPVCPNLKISTCATKMPIKVMEFDADLHGKHGTIVPLLSAKETAQEVIQKFIDAENFLLDENKPIALLINNLGTTNQMEESIFLNEMLTQLEELNIQVIRLYCGYFMTSISMAGFTITIFKISDPNTLNYLDAPCKAPAWRELPRFVDIRIESTAITLFPSLQDENKHEPPRINDRHALILKRIVRFVCNALVSCERQLNLMDSERGDADTGTNVRNLAIAILLKVQNPNQKWDCPYKVFQEFSQLAEEYMQGVISWLFSIMFEAIVKSFIKLRRGDRLSPQFMLTCMQKTCEALARYGNMKLGEGTMFDALHACVEAFELGLDEQSTWMEALELAAAEAELAAAKTKQNNTYPDPGAHTVALCMRALYQGFKFLE